MAEVTTHFRTCNLCEAMCGLEITVRETEIISIRGDAADPFSQGHICPKATALADIHADPDRLRRPARRTADGWSPLAWDDAYDEVAARIRHTQAQYGPNSVGLYIGNPTVHNLGAMLFGAPFIRALRTQQLFSATSVDQLPHHVASLAMLGHYLLTPVPDIDRTDFMLIMGANPVVSNGSLMTAPGVERRLKAIQRRGGAVVVIDPRRTRTAAMADRHHFIRPGADALLLLALIHTIFARGWNDLGRLGAFTDGLEALRAAAAPYAPERVAAHTGIAAESIVALAHDFAHAPSAVAYARMGLSTQPFGTVCQWLTNALNVITGNFDRAGGAMFTRPAIDIVALRPPGRFDNIRSRVRGLPAFVGEFPVATLADEILTPGEGKIRLLITVAGNPVLSTPDGARLDKALAQLDYMVSIDIYRNETTRHADIILPPRTGLENPHYDLIFHNVAVRNTVKFAPPLFEGAPDTRADWEIFQALRARLSADLPDKPGRRRFDVTRRFNPAQIVDLGLRFGPYGFYGAMPWGEDGLSLRTVAAEPHGIDLGPLQPCLPERLFTPEKTIDLAPARFVADLARVAELLREAPDSGLRLIGRRELRTNNSWMHNSPRLVRGKDRCTLRINPGDAAARAIGDGAVVTVESRVGRVEATAELTDEMMPGVVSLPHGYGHARPGVALRVATTVPGPSVNDLTDPLALDALSGNAALNGIPVTVKLSSAAP